MKYVKYFQRLALLVLLCHVAIGCGSSKPDQLALSDELSRLTAEERLQLAPNAAFEAVLLRNPERVRELLQSQRFLFSQKNHQGLTPGMLAIRYQEVGLATEIINALNGEEILATDNEGRGYLSHIAEFGHVPLVDVVGEKYQDTLRWGWSRFHNLDMPDNQGRSALFYAANGALAQRLKEYWMQWSISWSISWTWMSGFYQQKDIEERNFLHEAALDNRFDTLLWAMGDICGDALWADSEFLFGAPALVGGLLDWLAGVGQAWTPLPNDLVNQQDFYGNTPLHLAVSRAHRDAARALMSCRHTRYTLQNEAGRTPLSELLANIDPQQVNTPQATRDLFLALSQMQNRYRGWWRQLQDIINTQDLEDKTALHYAAQLADPYYYENLKEYGDIFIPDKQGRTPEQIFQTRWAR